MVARVTVAALEKKVKYAPMPANTNKAARVYTRSFGICFPKNLKLLLLNLPDLFLAGFFFLNTEDKDINPLWLFLRDLVNFRLATFSF